MKKIILYTFIFSILFMSCEKDDNYAVSCKINGNDWISDGVTMAAIGSNGLLINATSNSKPTIALLIDKELYDSVGVYSLDSTNNSFLYGNNFADGFFVKTNKPGVIEVTSFDGSDKKITGKFNLTAFNNNGDSIVVSEGLFDLYYQ